MVEVDEDYSHISVSYPICVNVSTGFVWPALFPFTSKGRKTTKSRMHCATLDY